jgi:hypothetical protein
MRLKIFCGALLLLMFSTVVLNAQPSGGFGPCDNQDIDASCPIDTWVFVLAGGAFIFAAAHLYRKQKSQNARRRTGKI